MEVQVLRGKKVAVQRGYEGPSSPKSAVRRAPSLAVFQLLMFLPWGSVHPPPLAMLDLILLLGTSPACLLSTVICIVTVHAVHTTALCLQMTVRCDRYAIACSVSGSRTLLLCEELFSASNTSTWFGSFCTVVPLYRCLILFQ